MSSIENSHQRTKQTRSSAPSVSLLILEGGSAPSDGVAAAGAAPRKCVRCSADVDVANSSYAQIIGGQGTSSHGCMHTVCMQCFGLAHALRSADIKLKCPGFSYAYQSRRWIVHSPVGLLIQTYDVMGMRKRMGYVQYTLLILIYMLVEKLIEMNIYPNPARSDHEAACSECLSWSGRAWSDVKDITEADEDHSNDYFDFSITNADGVLLASEVTLPSIEFIIMAMNKRILPTLDESREMIQANTFNTDTDQTTSHSASGRVTSMSMNTDEVTMNMAELNVREFEVDDINDLDEDGLHHENKSIYEINNAKMDVPWQLDLNNKNTMKK